MKGERIILVVISALLLMAVMVAYFKNKEVKELRQELIEENKKRIEASNQVEEIIIEKIIRKTDTIKILVEAKKENYKNGKDKIENCCSGNSIELERFFSERYGKDSASGGK